MPTEEGRIEPTIAKIERLIDELEDALEKDLVGSAGAETAFEELEQRIDEYARLKRLKEELMEKLHNKAHKVIVEYQQAKSKTSGCVSTRNTAA